MPKCEDVRDEVEARENAKGKIKKILLKGFSSIL